MSPAAERLRALRRLHGVRGDAAGGRELAYLLYVGVLLGSLVAFPLVRAVVIFLSEPAALAALSSSSAPGVFAAMSAGILAVVVLLGRLRGPVTLQPFFVLLLADSDMPRRAALRRPFLRSASTVIVALTGVAVILAGALAGAGAASGVRSAVFALACACLGALCAVFWLVGQSLSAPASAAVVGGLVVVAVTAALPSSPSMLPWGWIGGLWPTDPESFGVQLALLGLLTALAVGAVPRLLDSLSGHQLLDDAERWQTATTAAVSGDFARAVGSLRARPTVGRSWRAVGAAPVPLRFFRRDAVATLRAPGRVVVAVVFLVLAWATLGLSVEVAHSVTWLPAAAGAVLAHLALGVFSDGFRHAAEAAGAAPLYGYSTARLYLLHALLPAAVAIATVIAGVGAALAMGASISGAGAAALLLPLLLALRAYDSAKGDLPLVLLTPSPTPAGDASGVFVAAWQADAALAAASLGAATMTMVANEAPLNAGVLVALTSVTVWLLTRRRLGRLG